MAGTGRRAEHLWSRIQSASSSQSVEWVLAGLPADIVPHLVQLMGPAGQAVWSVLGLSPATWKRRQSRRLTSEESDRVFRVSRILRAATVLFADDQAAACRWLAHPNRAFAGRAPLEFARTEVGADEVINVIGRLEHGVYT